MFPSAFVAAETLFGPGSEALTFRGNVWLEDCDMDCLSFLCIYSESVHQSRCDASIAMMGVRRVTSFEQNPHAFVCRQIIHDMYICTDHMCVTRYIAIIMFELVHLVISNGIYTES